MALRTKWRSGDDFLVRHIDHSIIVIEKKAGLLTHSTPGKKQPNLHDKLREFVRGRGASAVLPVHRLDRVVSGLLVYARTEAAQEKLIQQFVAHTTERRYLAAASGSLADDEGTYESLLVTNHASTRVFSTDKRSKDTRRAITHWRVVERLPSATIVEVKLETGVRNQIRVHFSDAGHPLLGERKYARSKNDQRTNRIFLHAQVLGFVHPTTNRSVRFEAPLPAELASWKRRLSPRAR